MHKEMLRARGLTVAGTTSRTASDMDFCLYAGSCTLLTGLGSSALDTVCRFFAGEGSIQAGSLCLEGENITLISRREMEKRHVIFLDGYPALIDSMTLGESLFLMKYNSLNKGFVNYAAICQQTNALIERYGLDFAADMPVAALDNAARRMFALLWSINQGVRLLVLYDFLQGLTAGEQEKILDLLKQIQREGITLLIGATRPDPYFSLAGQLIVLHGGRIIKKMYESRQFPSCYAFFGAGRASYTAARPAEQQPQLPQQEIQFYYQGIPTKQGGRFDLALHAGQIVLCQVPDSDEQSCLWRALTLAEAAGPSLYDNNRKLAQAPQKSLAHLHIATWAVWEDSNALFKNLSQADNVLLPSLPRLSQKWRYRKNAAVVLADKSFFAQPFSAVSPPPAGRVDVVKTLIARWRLYNPRLMLMGNVLSNADVVELALLQDFLRQLAARGTSVVLLETDRKACLPVCDWLVLMGEDGGVSQGNPQRGSEVAGHPFTLIAF